MSRLLLLLSLSLVLAPDLASSCTAGSHHKAAAATARRRNSDSSSYNSVDSVAADRGGAPALFVFDSGPKAKTRRKIACMSNSVDKDGCKVIFINLSALKERKVKFPLDARNSSRFLVLKKVSEEGLRFLEDPKSRAPTIVNYKNGDVTHTFVAKQGRVFGSVEVRGDGGEDGEASSSWYHLAACSGNMRCQLLLHRRQKRKKEEEEEDR